MISKEWRDARWKFAMAAVAVVLVALTAPTLDSYQQVKKQAEQPGYYVDEVNLVNGSSTDSLGDARLQEDLKPPEGLRQEDVNPVELAAQRMWGLYSAGGFVVLLPLAVLLGAPLISGEASGGTLSMLLSRPLSRTRLLLSKYSVCAAGLLVSAILGGALVVALAAARGYPLGDIGITGIVLSAVLFWLGSLFVLGVSLLVSVLTRSVTVSIAASVLAVLVTFVFPGPFINYSFQARYDALGVSQSTVQQLSLPQYWYSESLYAGQSLVLTHFLVSLLAAALPLILALLLFKKRAY